MNEILNTLNPERPEGGGSSSFLLRGFQYFKSLNMKPLLKHEGPIRFKLSLLFLRSLRGRGPGPAPPSGFIKLFKILEILSFLNDLIKQSPRIK